MQTPIRVNRVQLFWEFHKSTLLINWGFSIAFAMVNVSIYFILLPIFTMTGGPILSLFFKELSRKNEYYYYYNRNISKLSLIAGSTAFNLLTGWILIKIISHV